MSIASQLTLAEMKAIIRALTHLHDSIVIANDPRWVKPEDPHWEKYL